MSKRGKNEGSIRQRANGRWEARFTIGYREDGKPNRVSRYADTRKNAVKLMQKALASVGRGEYVPPSKYTLISWCREWFEVYKSPVIRENTRDKYLASIKRLSPHTIAQIALKDLTRETIQKFYNKLSSEGLCCASIKIQHTLINGALSTAEESKIINLNPAKNIKIPKNSVNDGDERAKALTTNEYSNFIQKISEKSLYYPLALFMGNTGIRIGEALALNREDLDIDKCEVKISKTFNSKTKVVQMAPKTKKSNRTVQVPKEVIKLMKEHMFTQVLKGSKQPLFYSVEGTRISARNVLRRFNEIGTEIGCPWVNTHSLRHTYASRLFEKKVDIKIISALLGHDKVSTTYDLYIHFINNALEDSVAVLTEDIIIPDKMPQKQFPKKILFQG